MKKTTRQMMMALVMMVVMAAGAFAHAIPVPDTIYAWRHAGHIDVQVIRGGVEEMRAEFDTMRDVRRYARARRMKLVVGSHAGR